MSSLSYHQLLGRGSSIFIFYLFKHKSTSWVADEVHPARAFLLSSASGPLLGSYASICSLTWTPYSPSQLCPPLYLSNPQFLAPHCFLICTDYRCSYLCTNSLSGSISSSTSPAHGDNTETKTREGLHRTRKLALTGEMRGAALGIFKKYH